MRGNDEPGSVPPLAPLLSGMNRVSHLQHHMPAGLQLAEDQEQAVEGEAGQFAGADAGEFGMGDAGQGFGFAGGEAAGVEAFADVQGQVRLGKGEIGIGQGEITEYMAVTMDYVDFLIVCRMRLMRCLIVSISDFGVAMPVFDFF